MFSPSLLTELPNKKPRMSSRLCLFEVSEYRVGVRLYYVRWRHIWRAWLAKVAENTTFKIRVGWYWIGSNCQLVVFVQRQQNLRSLLWTISGNSEYLEICATAISISENRYILGMSYQEGSMRFLLQRRTGEPLLSFATLQFTTTIPTRLHVDCWQLFWSSCTLYIVCTLYLYCGRYRYHFKPFCYWLVSV